MAAASPIFAPVITRVAASCRLDQPAGSSGPGAGVDAGGIVIREDLTGRRPGVVVLGLVSVAVGEADSEADGEADGALVVLRFVA
jgi:hypothetical protein